MSQPPSRAGISKAQIEDIKDRVGIEDIVKRYVKLKPVGKNLFGNCPFHSEKTPSFSVNSELNIFKCYGCGEGGDVITFIEKIESLDFREAIELLAKEAGVALAYSKISPAREQAYAKAKKAHELAGKYYHYILTRHPLGENANKYLAERGMKKEVIDEFQLGLAPSLSSSQSLLSFLKKEGFEPKELLGYGLAIERNNLILDKFSDRIMFPVFSTTGEVLGFNGRVYKKTDQRPKYINSPETLLFQKRRLLYDLYRTKNFIKKEDLAIFVEGATDVISSWTAGVKNIVAPLGTGTTTDQLEKVGRYSTNIAIAFDADAAGENARKRLAILALSKGCIVYSIAIPYGNDADECIRKNPSLWKQAIEDRKPVISYFLELLISKYDPNTLEGKKHIISEIAPLYNATTDTIARDHHIKEMNLLLGVPADILEGQLKGQVPSFQKDEAAGRPSQAQPEHMSPERYLLSIVLQFPEVLSWASEKIHIEDIELAQIRTAVEALIENFKRENTISVAAVLDNLDDDTKELCTDLLMQPLWTEEPSADELTKEVVSTIRHIKERAIRREITELRRELALAEHAGDTRRANDTLNEINSRLKEIEALRT